MNTLQQHKLFLLGSSDAIKNLANKDCATILAVSDSHGHKNLLTSILEHFGNQADALTFCGDGINDVAELLDGQNINSNLKNFIPPVMAIVRGNGDESFIDIDFFQNEKTKIKKIRVPAAINFFAAENNILVTHGHLFGIYYGTAGLENHANEINSKIVLYGHTHVACISENNGVTFINPGSISMPRQGLPPSFAVIKVFKSGCVDCTFYEIKVSLAEGLHFVPFSPLKR